MIATLPRGLYLPHQRPKGLISLVFVFSMSLCIFSHNSVNHAILIFALGKNENTGCPGMRLWWRKTCPTRVCLFSPWWLMWDPHYSGPTGEIRTPVQRTCVLTPAHPFCTYGQPKLPPTFNPPSWCRCNKCW